ncbi:MAG: hypothetical protein J5I47_04710 [Vicingus serpentipes]|nr:hypothetical protein [Vicingus serpentipes]
MDKIKTTIVKALSIWSLFGVFLVGLGSTGLVPVSDGLIVLFSQEVVDKLQQLTDLCITAWGVITLLAQVVRGAFSKDLLKYGLGVKALDDKEYKRFIRSPFAIL